MISLRLSEEEYDILRDYRTYGARNISEFARLALQRLKPGWAGWPDGLADKFAELDARVRTLESHVSLLLERERVVQ
ncbi:MAG: hypothetical protein ABSF25_16155 [Bryobacteraceae bacterium]|jgi:hypothetical protein